MENSQYVGWLIEALGWCGSVLVVAAYALNANGKISASSAIYKWFNIIGSFLLIILTYYHRAIPSMVVNIIWVFIGLWAVVRKK